jgi:hypothetical protein
LSRRRRRLPEANVTPFRNYAPLTALPLAQSLTVVPRLIEFQLSYPIPAEPQAQDRGDTLRSVLTLSIDAGPSNFRQHRPYPTLRSASA